MDQQRRAIVATPVAGGGSLLSLFASGEDGFLFGDFAELDELFTTSTGPTNVAADGDPVGLALDDHSWGGKTRNEVLATATELRSTGTLALAGSATAATYDTGAGAGSATRVDFSNQSAVSFAATNGRTYALDIETTSANGLFVRGGGPTSASLFTFAGSTRQVVQLVAAGGAFALTAQNAGTATFTVHSIKEVPGYAVRETVNISRRPLWKANAGKPFLLNDGLDDSLVSLLKATPSFTVALAVRYLSAGVAKFALGAGTLATRRVALGISTVGLGTYAWGATNHSPSAAVITGQDLVQLMTGDPANRQFWQDGVLLESAAPSGSAFDGSGDGVTLGAYTTGGSATNFADCRIYAALAINRKIAPAEVALISNRFRTTYQ